MFYYCSKQLLIMECKGYKMVNDKFLLIFCINLYIKHLAKFLIFTLSLRFPRLYLHLTFHQLVLAPCKNIRSIGVLGKAKCNQYILQLMVIIRNKLTSTYVNLNSQVISLKDLDLQIPLLCFVISTEYTQMLHIKHE